MEPQAIQSSTISEIVDALFAGDVWYVTPNLALAPPSSRDSVAMVWPVPMDSVAHSDLLSTFQIGSTTPRISC